VHETPRVLLQVRTSDSHPSAFAADAELEFAVRTDRFVVLRDLEVLRQVGVEVVLPVEGRLFGDVGVDGLPDADGGLDGALVQYRERAGQPQADRAGVGVVLGVR
jgi:hypothetical protein